MEYLDTPIISNDIIDHMDQSGSKNERTLLMSYLQDVFLDKEFKIINIMRS